MPDPAREAGVNKRGNVKPQREERAPEPVMSRKEFDALVPQLRIDLLDLQRVLREAGKPVVVVIGGADAVKSDTVNALNGWLDPRGTDVNAFGGSFRADPARPRFAPYWDALPRQGRIGLFCGSWYTPLVQHRLERQISRKGFLVALERIAFFERMLAESGVLIFKFWMGLDRRAQKARLKALSRDRQRSWKVNDDDWKRLDLYDRYPRIIRDIMVHTDSPVAPWTIVDGRDDRYRHYTTGRLLADMVSTRFNGTAQHSPPDPVELPQADDHLGAVDLTRKLEGPEYVQRLTLGQARLRELSTAAFLRGIPTVVAFEGWDAAGKGSTIRRIVETMDARSVRVIPVGAPSEDELQYHYLWRFWRHVPRAGHTTIFDRSWYGRVLVERVEGFATDREWRRAYQEINDFELNLASDGVVISKFWLHLSPEEQLRRFEDRQNTSYKAHKITEEDWRNRAQWDAYYAAVNDMLAHTDRAPAAPWFIIPSEDKHYARVKAIETICDQLERALGKGQDAGIVPPVQLPQAR
jgi:polyphosphate:AMP phosphotransferase